MSSIIVIDNGSGFCKAGFVSEKNPQTIQPSVIGRQTLKLTESRGFYVGDEVDSVQESLLLTHPIKRGMIINSEDMKQLWTHIVQNKMKSSLKDGLILLTETPLNTKANREMMAKVMFEYFKVSALFIANQAVLSLYCTGKQTGVVVDIGDGVTCISSVNNGYIIPESVQRMEVAGKDLTDYLGTLLLQKGYNNLNDSRDLIKKVKEELCYVAKDPKIETGDQKDYKTPSGQKITLTNERFQCPEALFQPSILGLTIDGLHKQVYKSIMTCDQKLRKELYGNIVVTGGSSAFDGLTERLQKELTELAEPNIKINIIKPTSTNSSWTGGSILGALLQFKDMMVTRDEYQQNAFDVINKKWP